jgi:hypothetical protein
VKITSYLRVGSTTTLNIVVFAATGWKYLWLEGRVFRGVFRNWARRYPYAPSHYEKPAKEEEIVRIVRCAAKVRVFGSAHSFNEGNVSDEVLISMHNYSGVVPSGVDLAKNEITVKGGTRLRDVVKLLGEYCLALPALPSHDAQSIAGILSTDVHGTAKVHETEPLRGFISESVVRLKLLDGKGDIIVCRPEDDLFKAAIGGIGAVGVILEVTVRAVPRFNIKQQVEICNVGDVEENLDALIQGNDHFSLYVFPFAQECQVNTWNRTYQPRGRNANIREFANISSDALLAAWVGNLLAYTKLLPLSRHRARLYYLIRRGSKDLVLESDAAFNRTIYHLHQELEFTVPYDRAFYVCKLLRQLFEKMYEDKDSPALPYTLFEMRFTPAGHNRTLIGAGQERASAWIDIITNDSDGFEEYFAAAMQLIREEGGRPHLGKYCTGFDVEYLQQLYGEHLERFQRLIVEHDPENKFANAFTKRLFGTIPAYPQLPLG